MRRGVVPTIVKDREGSFFHFGVQMSKKKGCGAIFSVDDDSEEILK